MRSDREHKIQAEFIKWVRLNEMRIKELQLLYAIPNQSYGGTPRDKVRGAKFKREGRRAGVPDLHLPVPFGGYASLYMEVKDTGKYPTPDQKSFSSLLESCGNKYVICRSTTELIKNIKIYLNL